MNKREDGRMNGMKLLTITGVLAGVTVACTSTKTKLTPGPTVTQNVVETATQTATVTTTPTVVRTIATHTKTRTVTIHPTFSTYGTGIYVVGSDIKPGLYFTRGDSSGTGICYYARLSSLDPSAIIANNDSGTGPQTVEVQSGDRAFQVEGGCTFGRR